MRDRKPTVLGVELDLVPIMNLVTILIPFLLMGAQFVAFAVIDVPLPAVVWVGPPQPTVPFELTVRVDHDGYEVSATSGELALEPVRVGCLATDCVWQDYEAPWDAYDVRGLREVLSRVKDLHPDERSVNLVSAEDVPYEALVLAMDATREDPDDLGDGRCRGRCLFPEVKIGMAPEA